MTATPEQYEGTANTLVERIKALVPDNPQILDMENVSDLLKIDGFKIDDLQPSIFQAQWALAKVKKEAE